MGWAIVLAIAMAAAMTMVAASGRVASCVSEMEAARLLDNGYCFLSEEAFAIAFFFVPSYSSEYQPTAGFS